jgi:hypothetical protein
MRITLRRIVDAVMVLTILGLVGGVAAFELHRNEEERAVGAMTETVRDFERMLRLRAATKDVELNGRGWPTTIDPGWFDEEPPRNTLVSPDRPWVEIAPPEDAGLLHPPIRIVVSTDLASFWYNPYQGVVRARVPVSISDRQALDLYNKVNGTNLESIFVVEQPAPRPEAAEPPAAEPEPLPTDEDPGNLDPTLPT